MWPHFWYKLEYNCPFTKIFGTLITKSKGHRQVFLVSHLTNLVQLRDLNIINLALNCRFSQCYNTKILTAKLSPYYFTYLLSNLWFIIEQSRLTADNKVVYQWVRWEIRLASDNSWAWHCLKHVSWRLRWIIFLCTLYTWIENDSFMRNLTSWSVPFWLVHLTEHRVLHCYATNAVYRCLVAGQLYPSCSFSSADCQCFQFSNPCQAIHSTLSVHHTAL